MTKLLMFASVTTAALLAQTAAAQENKNLLPQPNRDSSPDGPRATASGKERAGIVIERAPDAPKNATQWEYKVSRAAAPDERLLNSLGSDGWELVGMFAPPMKSSTDTGIQMIFKRQKR